MAAWIDVKRGGWNIHSIDLLLYCKQREIAVYFYKLYTIQNRERERAVYFYK